MSVYYMYFYNTVHSMRKREKFKNVNFSEHDVYLGETKEQLKKDFGNFLAEDGNKITLLDDKKGSLTLTMMNDKVAFINSIMD